MWDVNIIETAMKDFYNNDLNTMIEAINMNITVSFSLLPPLKNTKLNFGIDA